MILLKFQFWNSKGTKNEVTRKEIKPVFAKRGVYGTILANFNTNLGCKRPELCTNSIVLTVLSNRRSYCLSMQSHTYFLVKRQILKSNIYYITDQYNNYYRAI